MARTSSTAEAEIRALMADWTDAVRSKNVDRVMSHYAPDIVAFDIAPPLENRGAAEYRENWTSWFPTFRGEVGYEMRDLVVTAGENVAFCRSLNHIRGTRENGERTDVWVRATVGFRRMDGSWKVTHEHVSVPFYMDGSYRAAVDLAPAEHAH